MDNIHLIIQAAGHTGGRCVLATLIHVDGSAYRKAGTAMLIQENGECAGVLTAGCLETDLIAQAQHVLEENTPQMRVYDMRLEDEAAWGRGAGCSGVLHILLEPVDDRLRTHLNALQAFLDNGHHVTIVKASEGPASGDYLFIAGDGEHRFGHWRGDVPDSLLNLILDSPSSGLKSIPGFAGSLFIHRFLPKPRLFLFGAGADARPVAAFAAKSGFSVTVSDWRPVLCSRAHFPDAEELAVGFPHEIVPQLAFRPTDSVIIMTHDFQRDQELLRALPGHKLRYVGVLGPAARTARLLGEADFPDWIQSPAGMDIGAEGPEEIAVSIVADLIKTMRGGRR